MICGSGWNWKRRVKDARKNNMKSYMVNQCAICVMIAIKIKVKNMMDIYYCKFTSCDVGQSHFGLNSPRNCPKR